MEAVLEHNGLKEFIDTDVPKPDVIDVADLDACKKKVEKATRIMLEGVRDHIVLSLHGKSTPYAMWKALTDLRMRMKRSLLWLPRRGKGRGRNSILNLSPRMARSKTCPR